MATSPTLPPKPTLIQTLHARWDQVNANYRWHEKAIAELGNAEEKASTRHQHEMTTREAIREATHLVHAILYQHPQDLRDCLILSVHVSNLTELIDGTATDDSYALEAGMESMIAFLACQPEAGGPVGGWGQDTIDSAREISARRMEGATAGGEVER